MDKIHGLHIIGETLPIFSGKKEEDKWSVYANHSEDEDDMVSARRFNRRYQDRWQRADTPRPRMDSHFRRRNDYEDDYHKIREENRRRARQRRNSRRRMDQQHDQIQKLAETLRLVTMFDCFALSPNVTPDVSAGKQASQTPADLVKIRDQELRERNLEIIDLRRKVRTLANTIADLRGNERSEAKALILEAKEVSLALAEREAKKDNKSSGTPAVPTTPPRPWKCSHCNDYSHKTKDCLHLKFHRTAAPVTIVKDPTAGSQ